MNKKLLIYNINPNSISINNIQKHIKIVAPTSGIIVSLNLTKGEYITDSSEIARIEKNTDHFLKIKVTSNEVSFIKKGQKINAISINNPDKKIELNASISQIKNEQNEDGTFTILAKIDKNESSKFSEHIRYNVNFEFNVLLESTRINTNFNSKKL